MSFMAELHSSLSTTLAGVHLTGPLISAAGTGGTATELEDVLDLADFGAVTTKSITPEPRAGNPAMRVADVPAGMLNAVGLMNMGVDAFLAGTVPALSGRPTTFIGSVAGHSIEDYVQVAAAFDAVEAFPLIELNLSCPNSSTGRRFTDGPSELAEVVREVRRAVVRSRILVKLPLLFETAVPMAAAAIEAGADGLTMINTVPALSIDVEDRTSRLGFGHGGLSGPAVHLPALSMVQRIHAGVARDAQVPIVGLGGVRRWEQAAAFVLAGATAVGIGTTLYHDHRAPRRINRGLARWVAAQGCSRLDELVGQVRLPA